MNGHKARKEYLRSRQRWVEDRPAPVTVPPKQRRGRRPRTAGAVAHRLRLPWHEDTTAQLMSLYPFQVGTGLPPIGAYIGVDRFTRGAMCFDPFALYRAGILSNPNMIVAGVIGSGKSSLLKTLALRMWAFGHRFCVPADTKGEMAATARLIGAPVSQLGKGHSSLNPLYAPPLDAALLASMKQRDPDADEGQYRRLIEAHRLLLLRSLGETAAGRPLTAVEDLLIELALAEAMRAAGTSSSRLATPTMPQLVEIMLAPTEEMAASVPIELDLLKRESLHLALRFRTMVRSSLHGVFDGTDPVQIDLNAPGFVIDISRIRASDAATALTMTCGQALIDLMLTFSDSQWLKILDECWRQIRYPAIVRRISEGQKLARGDATTTGSATIIALHRISDLMGASPGVRELAMGLLADASTRVVYQQASDQLATTQQALSLTDQEAASLPRFGVGTALWKVGGYSTVADHVVLRDGKEWPLIETDSRMGAEDELTRSAPDPAGAMAEELQ